MSERVAAIDCGTNSIRLLIADLVDGQLIEVDRRMTIVRLGQGVDATGAFAPEALTRVFKAADDFAAVVESLGVDRLRFVATSAARDVSNRDEFLTGIEARLGVRPEIISGTEEAELSFRGATTALDLPAPYLVADIGGGSTELVLGDANGVLAAESLDIGSVRLTERHVTTDPTSPAELAAITRDVDALLDGTTVPLAQARALIGVAGTATTVAAVALGLPQYDRTAVHHAHLSADQLHQATTWLTTSTRTDRTAVQSIHPGRVDVIGAGAVILQRLFNRLALDELVISEQDILDGVALSLA
ncbi:exopolyphosphatase/guanosine-5'-triphosphate,3'-diphosphate pyrophosphatase [Kribbella rubisoli]|uniref:Exopolyphosphatase/guanosine-5'-triphosphate, 3'-diphosphate pyrophosphatase n=1 Tax=Kribbella rubisoli TaxID=3075929 RepID=A0A4Q7X7D4_9ACTN|nr:Ppx/GppA phosphatase family protein [Kribbella rubisoli]RZU18982.1 exopolyphosphatase/guanosine-5'-triphosphate,3'-diphosphate pyrophosphatase [Kribbella rubisoli]